MKETVYRTTFSLDEGTARRLSRLAAVWRVSRAEVVRRAVAMAEAGSEQKADAEALFQKLHASGKGLAREAAESYLQQVRTDRAAWRGEG